MIYISPSLLAADFAHLEDDITRIENAGANYLHLDIMDGHFVPNLSFGADIVGALRKTTKLIFDIHLMISDPVKYIPDFIRAGADIVTVHFESTEDPEGVLRMLRDREVKAGLAISPATPVESIIPIVKSGLCSMVLVMTVVPGFGGQKLIPETLDKVRKLRRLSNLHALNLDIEVDGGINADNVGFCTSSGANVIVAGTAIFRAKKPNAVIKAMRESARNNPFPE